MDRIFLYLALLMTMIGCEHCFAQQGPVIASVEELANNAKKYDGRVVRVHALLAFGWEGDNFLYEPGAAESLDKPSNRNMHVWFYCTNAMQPDVCGSIFANYHLSRIEGTFTGTFHFVPDQKSRMKDVFDPGPFQFEVFSVSDLKPLSKSH